MAKQSIVAFRRDTVVSTTSGHTQAFQGAIGAPVRRRDVLQEALARGGMLVEKAGEVNSLLPDTAYLDDMDDGSDGSDELDELDQPDLVGAPGGTPDDDEPISKLQHLANTVRTIIDEDNPDLLTDDGKVKVSTLADRAKDHVTAEERDQAHALLDKGEA